MSEQKLAWQAAAFERTEVWAESEQVHVRSQWMTRAPGMGGGSTDLRARVGPAVDDLRRGIQRAPAERLQELALVVEVGETKVGDLWGRGRHGHGQA